VKEAPAASPANAVEDHAPRRALLACNTGRPLRRIRENHSKNVGTRGESPILSPPGFRVDLESGCLLIWQATGV
jgi:hypothetical protein